ncbi:MAG TPA: ABC transporter substrate-binding protein [Microvirga sp.]|jgi:peptide/nickel transport system substrate-binding protein|nr:ABC transporter substrate-binding protein [Microvirga sp.]
MNKALLASLMAAAALTISAAAVQAQQNTMRIGLNEDPDVLDPTLARTYVGRIVFASLCDKLFDIDEKANAVPQLALSHETLDDGKTMIIKLRPNVKFHDGETMDAEAVRYSLDRHMTMQGSFRKPELAAVDKVEVVDPLTVKLTLKTPFSPLLSQLTDRAGMIVSPKAAKEAGDRFGAKPVCAGPFKFVDRVQQDRITLERFADYWDKDKIKIDRVVFQPITDGTVKLANLKSGQLDLIERPLATDLAEIRSNPNLKLVALTDLGFNGMWINVSKGEPAKGPLGQDARVRQALELAIDREALNQVVFNGEYVVGNQWISPDKLYYQEKFPVPKRDVSKAKQLLQQAGVKTPVAVDFMVPNTTEAKASAEVIQAMAAEAGFDMKIRLVEFATGLKEAEEGRYQAFLLNWSGRTDPDGNLYIFMKTGAPQNYGGYSNANVDKALDEARLKSDPKERKAIYERVAAETLKDNPYLYLYHRKVLIAHSNKVEGYRQMPDGLIRLQGVSMKR